MDAKTLKIATNLMHTLISKHRRIGQLRKEDVNSDQASLAQAQFYCQLFDVFIVCPVAPIVEAVELILHTFASNDAFARVASELEFCFSNSEEHRQVREKGESCSICVLSRKQILSDAKLQDVVDSFVRWIKRRALKHVPYQRQPLTLKLFRSARNVLLCKEINAMQGLDNFEQFNLTTNLENSPKAASVSPAVVQ